MSTVQVSTVQVSTVQVSDGAQSHELCLLLLESKTARSTTPPRPSSVKTVATFVISLARYIRYCNCPKHA